MRISWRAGSLLSCRSRWPRTREDRDRSFAASDARVQMIFPNPLNAQRYVLVVAATSADAVLLGSRPLRDAEFDFTIETGMWRGATGARRHRGVVAGGWFNRNCRSRMNWFCRAMPRPGEERGVNAPRPDRAIDPKILDSYVAGTNWAEHRDPGAEGWEPTDRSGGRPDARRVSFQPRIPSSTWSRAGEAGLREGRRRKVVALKGWQNGRRSGRRRPSPVPF